MTKKPLRSQLWFDDRSHPSMTALYLERYLNYGLTLDELRSGRPDHRHRADAAATSCPATATTWRSPSA